MDVRQLAALVAVADHGTFSAAARALYTVQSNVSGHVAKLEREIGDRVERTAVEPGLDDKQFLLSPADAKVCKGLVPTW